LRRCKELSTLAAIAFAPNVSRNQPHQPGGKMKSQPYWTRLVVASMGVQAMCAFSCSPNGKKACRSSWCLSRRRWLALLAHDVLPGHRPTRNSVPIGQGSPRRPQPGLRRSRRDKPTNPWCVPHLYFRIEPKMNAVSTCAVSSRPTSSRIPRTSPL
jgi:hypothetical protein